MREKKIRSMIKTLDSEVKGRCVAYYGISPKSINGELIKDNL